MPTLTYTPTGADPLVFDFAFEDLLLPECSVIVKFCGVPGMREVMQGFKAGNPDAILATLFVLWKRQRPTLTIDQVQPTFSELEIGVSEAEIRSALEGYDDGRLVIESDEEAAQVAQWREMYPPVQDEVDESGVPVPKGKALKSA